MCGKWTYLISIVLVLGLAGTVSAELIAYWQFEGDFIDTSGNGHDGTPFDSPAIVEDSIRGQVLEVNGTSRVRVADVEDFNFTENDSFSYMVWVNYDSSLVGSGWRTIFVKGRTQDGGGTSYDANALYGFWISPDGNWHVSCGNVRADTDPAQAGQWHHLAAVQDGDAGTVTFYIDGQEIAAGGGSAGPCVSPDWPLFIGAAGTDQSPFEGFGGRIDEVKIYNHALTVDEIMSAMEGTGAYPYALSPEPADGSVHEDTWVNLAWRAGDLAVSHDLYIGDNFDDVNDGAEVTFVGNRTDTFIVVGFPGFPYPDGLIPGTTYYWRVDEVNEAEPNSPWKGDVWSFSIPPKTAYNPEPADGAESVDVGVRLSWTGGFGAKLHTVYFGDNFEEVDNAAGGQSQANTTYTPGPLKMAETYYWRVDEFDIIETYKGDVWSFITEGAVSNPSPAKGAVDVTQTPALTWTPGVFADTHEIYFGADPAALELKSSGNLGEESFEPGQLEWNTTYYWRIDESNSANADSPWTRPLWNFTTANFLIIDDFESYNDLDPADPESSRIFLAWIDGFDNPAVNGSVVGYANPPFAEQTIVHSGNQSMPFAYDNAVGKSEATLNLTSNRDWTVNGVDTLTIWYRGSSSNAAETMYVVLNGSAGVDNENSNAAQATVWTEWNVDLQAFADQGVNLTNITSITLGLGNRANPTAGGSGMVHFDDIRLYAHAP
jgi:hypothetical protein